MAESILQQQLKNFSDNQPGPRFNFIYGNRLKGYENLQLFLTTCRHSESFSDSIDVNQLIYFFGFSGGHLMKTFLARLFRKEEGAGAIEAVVLFAFAILVLLFGNSMWGLIKEPYSARMADLGDALRGNGNFRPPGGLGTPRSSNPVNLPDNPMTEPSDNPSGKPGIPVFQQPPSAQTGPIVPANPLPVPQPSNPGSPEQPGPTSTPEIPTPKPIPTLIANALEETLAELHPNRLGSIDQRVDAYKIFSNLLAKNGNQSKFAEAASIVSDQISGVYQNTVYFGPETEEHLGYVNDELYRLNYSILCALVRNPNVFPDPYLFLPESVKMPTFFDGAPYDALSFDKRMVRAEQAMVTQLNERLQGPKRTIVMDELDDSFSPATIVGLPKDPVASVLYGNPTTRWVRDALNGRPIMFSHEPTRVALGHAMIYNLQGLGERQFFDYKAKDPTFPKYPRPIPTPIPNPITKDPKQGY
ncbi:MAG: hypothetical protein NTV55_10475 [Planctomycetota bacterium]|nr:hypothetical protein [Planctomycetota bacterium]